MLVPVSPDPMQPVTSALAVTCPRCRAVAAPRPGVQVCGACRGTFALHAGARLEPSVVPPPVDPRLPRVVVKSAGVVVMKRGVVAAEGVTEGTLDPVAGLVAMDESGVLYGDILSVAVWRTIDVVRLVVAVLIPVPLGLLSLVGAVAATPWFLIPGVLFGGLGALMVYRAIGIRACHVRIVGTWRVVALRFDSPMRRRRPFHDELLRRAGIPPAPIP
jgi:hypothetical protein